MDMAHALSLSPAIETIVLSRTIRVTSECSLGRIVTPLLKRKLEADALICASLYQLVLHLLGNNMCTGYVLPGPGYGTTLASSKGLCTFYAEHSFSFRLRPPKIDVVVLWSYSTPCVALWQYEGQFWNFSFPICALRPSSSA